MTKEQWFLLTKITLAGLLVATILGFFYFDGSLIMRITVCILGAFTLFRAFFQKIGSQSKVSRHELLIILTLYLGLLSLYNLLYGLGIPLYLLMIAVWILVCALFFGLTFLDRVSAPLGRPLFLVFISLTGLTILEIFLSMSFWPVDPKLKSLIIVVIFYLITNLIYLYAHNMLRFKKTIGYLIVSLLVIGLLILNIWTSLKGGL